MVIHKIRHHLAKYHKIRKWKEADLPFWKEKWHQFNQKHLHWLEKVVEFMLPWLVLLLLFIILGEFAHLINIFHWKWLDAVALFFEQHEQPISYIDKTITGFFVVDIYFNFFRKKTFWSFLKTSFIDILAVAPLGFIFRVGGLTEAQSILHVTVDAEKEVTQLAKEGEEITKLTKEVAKSEELAKIARFTKAEKIAVEVEKIPGALRLYRATELKDVKKHKRKKQKHSKEFT
jgi:hypothetical protein